MEIHLYCFVHKKQLNRYAASMAVKNHNNRVDIALVITSDGTSTAIRWIRR
jgi:hypothetical protein